MKVKELIRILEVMDPERDVVSHCMSGNKIRGVGTIIVNDKKVAVIR